MHMDMDNTHIRIAMEMGRVVLLVAELELTLKSYNEVISCTLYHCNALYSNISLYT